METTYRQLPAYNTSVRHGGRQAYVYFASTNRESSTRSTEIKDKAEHLSYGGDYLSTLQMISERHSLCLVRRDRQMGLSPRRRALLPLLRAFINYSQTKSRLRDSLLFDEDKLAKADESRQGGDAAFCVLANESNQLLPLWTKGGGGDRRDNGKVRSRLEEVIKYEKACFSASDQVLQLCRMAHQEYVYSRDGVEVNLTPRRQLEGLDFMDVATPQGTIWPLVHYIQTWAKDGSTSPESCTASPSLGPGSAD